MVNSLHYSTRDFNDMFSVTERTAIADRLSTYPGKLVYILRHNRNGAAVGCEVLSEGEMHISPAILEASRTLIKAETEGTPDSTMFGWIVTATKTLCEEGISETHCACLVNTVRLWQQRHEPLRNQPINLVVFDVDEKPDGSCAGYYGQGLCSFEMSTSDTEKVSPKMSKIVPVFYPFSSTCVDGGKVFEVRVPELDNALIYRLISPEVLTDKEIAALETGLMITHYGMVAMLSRDDKDIAKINTLDPTPLLDHNPELTDIESWLPFRLEDGSIGVFHTRPTDDHSVWDIQYGKGATFDAAVENSRHDPIVPIPSSGEAPAIYIGSRLDVNFVEAAAYVSTRSADLLSS